MFSNISTGIIDNVIISKFDALIPISTLYKM